MGFRMEVITMNSHGGLILILDGFMGIQPVLVPMKDWGAQGRWVHIMARANMQTHL
jgi:hypothetical protein